jgi:hypothetical protein
MQTDMNLSAKVTIPTQVMARQVGDEIVILDLARAIYFGLDPVGGRIWQLISEGKSLGDISDVLLSEYEVSREELQRDLARLLDELESRGLISRG